MKKIMLAFIAMLLVTACAPAQPVAPSPYPTYTPYPNSHSQVSLIKILNSR